MAKLQLAQIVFADENGKQYPVNIVECSVGSSFAVKVSCDPQIASQLMAGALIGGGLDAVERLFVKSDEK